MRFNYLATAWLLANVVGSLHAQDTDRQKYSINQLSEPGQRPKNYWVAKPPAAPGESSRDKVRIIVRFKGVPSGRIDKNGRSSAAARINNEHQQFLSDLKQFENRSSSGRSAPTSKILFDYRQVFNGFALITTTDIKNEIRTWSYVSTVSEDKKVQLSDLESSKIIRAPQVWSEFGITGKGVTIGIIDTGIDYNHPDLGGGFGPSFKVKGGYDFVNNDSYPMDDHGHGTHVAGITAANGPGLKGVAPDANLIAYKVLAAEGYGYDSWILAAIERTVDPDQNPDTPDALDVVNMSLGRQADPNEPLSEAVNNAVAQGVTFVIAAGNDYDYLTVGTPGIAEDAITVAATDRYDLTANFSSKGPTQGTFALKPDVAAPGVDIYSSFKNGGYQTLSGTSMATPHVVGTVALLLEKHPDWTPTMIKAALMSTARKSTELIWNQGAGRVDIYDAIKADVIVTPGSFSLGIVSQSSSYTKTIKARVFNLSNTTKNFNFSLEGDISSSSFSVSFSPAVVSLTANSSHDVDVTFTINPSLLPTQNLPDAFTGYIITSDSSQNIKTPVTLVNPQITKVKFDGELPLSVFIFGVDPGNYFWKAYYPTSSELDLLMPNGTYDMISTFSKNYTVITEGISANTNNIISLSKDLAKNQLIFKPLDKYGNAIPITDATFGVGAFTGIDKNFITLYPYAEDTFHISDNSAYRYDMKMRSKSDFDSDHYYDINMSTENGASQSKTYSNDPSSFSELNIFNPSAGANQGLIGFERVGVPGFYMTTWNNYIIPIQNPWRLLVSGTDAGSKAMGSYAQLNPADQEPGYSWETSMWKISSGGNITLQDKAFLPIAAIPSSFDYNLGETLLRYSVQTVNSADKIVFLDMRSTGIFNRYYGEREAGRVYFKLFAGDDLVKEGNFANSTDLAWSGTQQVDATPRQYKMQLSYEDYQVHGKFGKATVELNFNTANDDKNTPHINYLSLHVNGKSVNQFHAGDHGTIIAKLDDTCLDQITWQECRSTGVATVSMYLKKIGADDWTKLDVQMQSDEFRASLPTTIDDGYYALKLTANDFGGNSIIYELNPGFLIGDAIESTPYANVNLIQPANKSINAGTNPLFRWSYFPTAEYVIQISDTISFTSNVIEASVSDVTYTLSSTLQKNTTYYWRVKANYNGKSIPWSTVFSFYSGTLEKTVLITPQQDATQQPLSVQFQWAKVDKVSSYGFQLYNTDLSSLVFQNYLFDTTLVVDNLLPNTKYEWNVSTNYFTWDNQYYIPSETSRFSTFSVEHTKLLQPIQGAINQPISVQFKWSKVDIALSYYFQLSANEDFSEPRNQVSLVDTTIVIDNLLPDTQYYWNVLSTCSFENGLFNVLSSTNSFKTSTITEIDDPEARREPFNYPNPFSTKTNVIFQADNPGVASLIVFDPLGQEVHHVDMHQAPGVNSIYWNGENKDAAPLPNGLYIGILKTGSGTSRIKMIIKR